MRIVMIVRACVCVGGGGKDFLATISPKRIKTEQTNFIGMVYQMCRQIYLALVKIQKSEMRKRKLDREISKRALTVFFKFTILSYVLVVYNWKNDKNPNLLVKFSYFDHNIS